MHAYHLCTSDIIKPDLNHHPNRYFPSYVCVFCPAVKHLHTANPPVDLHDGARRGLLGNLWYDCKVSISRTQRDEQLSKIYQDEVRISTTVAPGQGHLWDYAFLIILSCLFSPCLLSIDLFLIFLLAKSADKVTPCPPHTVSSILPKFSLHPFPFFFLNPHSFALLPFPPSSSLLSLPLPAVATQ